AFSPKTGLVYLPAQEVPVLYSTDPKWKYVPGAWNVAVDMIKNAPPEDTATFKALRAMLKGQLLAWDPVAQKEVWRVQYDGPWNGGALATAGNLVFQGNARGEFAAYSADKGKKLWAFDAQTGVIAGPISFAVDGTQYVAVMAGYGGAYALASPFTDLPGVVPANGRVLVFKIGGTATLPPVEKPVPAPANPPATKFSAAQIAEGQYLYEGNCGACHGAGVQTGGVLPDLRRSVALNDKALWDSSVLGGALKDRGMASFKQYFTPAQVESIRGYVGVQAQKLAAKEAAAPAVAAAATPAAGK
ncbi:MAG: PQQ-binding-like beta-propeller repeat protein, partial [Polymorphobacter sp.]